MPPEGFTFNGKGIGTETFRLDKLIHQAPAPKE